MVVVKLQESTKPYNSRERYKFNVTRAKNKCNKSFVIVSGVSSQYCTVNTVSNVNAVSNVRM